LPGNPALYTSSAWYYNRTRLTLQDEIEPYRYTDDTLTYCLNTAIREITRVRPDIFLDLKYQAPLQKGDTGFGYEGVQFSPPGTPQENILIPIPPLYTQAVIWCAAGMAQFLDVTDTQDQRASGFLQKFSAHLLTLTAA
jgi:hypothetical protein